MALVRSMTGAALLLAALAGCALIPADTPSDSLIGEWIVEDVDHGGVIDNANLTVAFDETGRVYGSAGCNRFTGAYTYDGAFSTLKVTPLGVTRRMCPEALMNQEGKLVQGLQNATRAETQGDGAVALTSATGRVLLRRRAASTLAAAKPVAAHAAAPVYDPAADPLAPKPLVTSPAIISATALPPPSTSSYPLAGGGAAPLYTPLPPPPSTSYTPPAAGAPMSTAPAYVTTPAPYTPPPSVTATAAPYLPPAAAPQPSRRITASGELYVLEQIALPPDAVVRVQLRDVARVGAPATVLGEQQFPASGGQPYPFAVTAPVNVIAPTARLTVFAQILSGNRLLFITDTSNPVPLEGTSTPLRIRLVNAAPAPTAVTRPQVQSPRTAPAPLSAAPPIAASPGAYVGIPLPQPSAAADIPNSVSYRCANERFRIAFEDRVAYLTTTDGAVARLARIDATDDPGAPKMFSNSILTVIKETESTGGARVRFARGRMALTACTPAE